MDKIYIKNLEIFASHGVLEKEKELPQKFLVSAEICINLRKAGLSDNLNDTADYSNICNIIEKTFTDNTYNLIEKCAEKTSFNILSAYPQVNQITVKVKKPWAPLGKAVSYTAVEITRARHKVYVGLGSNMGNRHANINTAIQLLNTEHTKVLSVSQMYETKPVSPIKQDDYINAVAETETLLTPYEYLSSIQHIEKTLKRERKEHWGPRTIDLDLLLYDNEITCDKQLIIPHPRMHERLFVLTPFCDIAPHLIHPLYNRRMISLKDELENIKST